MLAEALFLAFRSGKGRREEGGSFGPEEMVPSNTIISNDPANEQLCVERAKAISGDGGNILSNSFRASQEST
jgi:hypothetical protein